MAKANGGAKQAKPSAADYAAALSSVPEAQRARAVTAVVENPYGNGVDRVSVVDPIIAMARQGRLSQPELNAAERYRLAFEAVFAGNCSALALDVIDGGGGDGISERRLRGARDLTEAGRLLGPLEPHLRRVVAGDLTLEQLGHVIGETDKRRAKVAGSAFIKFAVGRLAEAWELGAFPFAR